MIAPLADPRPTIILPDSAIAALVQLLFDADDRDRQREAKDSEAAQ